MERVGWAWPPPPHPRDWFRTFYRDSGLASGRARILSPTPTPFCRTPVPLKGAYSPPRPSGQSRAYFAQGSACLPLCPWGLARLGWAWVRKIPSSGICMDLDILGWGRMGRGSTSVPHDVNFCWGPIPSRPCGPNLHQSMADVFRNCNFYPVLGGEVQCGSQV